MDERVEALRRALREDPSDLSVALRLASALEKTGRFAEAWELLDERDAREALAALAARSPRALLVRLRALDYPSARRFMERLAAIGQARNPALEVLAADANEDRVLRKHAARIVAASFSELGPEPLLPDALLSELEDGGFARHAEEDRPDFRAAIDRRRARARSFAERTIERAGKAHALALVPWLIPLLAARDPQLAARALEALRRLTQRDGPSFDADLLARLLDQGEAA